MNKIATLAKIANRLDSIGLTKEADVLDAFIRKVANELDGTEYDTETSGPTVKPADINLVSEDIANNINNEKPSINRTNFITEFIKRFTGSSAKPSNDPNKNWGQDAAFRMAAKQWDLLQSKVSPGDKSNSAPATGWEKYLSKAGALGPKVKQAWTSYSQSSFSSANPSFSSFTAWYNNQLKYVWGGDHKSPSEIISMLNTRVAAQPRTDSGSQATSREPYANPWNMNIPQYGIKQNMDE